MQKETNVNGGTKLLTASVVMTLGVGGALLFRQDAPATPRAESASGELLVRRSGAAPIASDYAAPYHREPSSTGLGVSRNGAQLTGSIDPFQNQGTLAGTERRLTADYGSPNPAQPLAAPAGVSSQFPYGTSPNGASPYGAAPTSPTSSPFPPQRYLIDPMSEAERTPMNNVTAGHGTANPQLPAEYPSAGETAAGSPPPTGSSTFSQSNSLGPMTPLGPSNVISQLNGGDRNRSAFVNAGTGAGATSNSGGRTVMPTLHANSGAVAQNVPPPFRSSAATAPAEESARPKSTKARRHRVRDGDTLASLAERYYGDPERYTAIYDANRGALSDPDLLPIGVELMIPPVDQASATAASASSTPPPAARLLPRVQIRPVGE